ncbi:MAG: carbonic anhydrase [Candidatus Hodarchaeota archaeon]
MIENIIDMFLNGNYQFRLKILKELEKIEPEGKIPKYPVLILTCIDPRIDVHRIFQLNPGDVFVLRNAGNIFTQDALRSILLTVYQYNIEYIIILGHLDCGMTKIQLVELKQKIPFEFLSYESREKLDLFSKVRDFFKPFIDELRNIKQQVKSLQRIQKYFPEVKITGMLYDVDTGWVFEYDKFKEFEIIENFRKHYETILREKKYQFIDFIESIEEEIIKNDKFKENVLEKDVQEKMEGELRKLDKKEKESPVYTVNREIDITSVKFQDQKIELDKDFNTRKIIQKIQVPKIHFPGVKIYIPKISRKKDVS